MKNVSSIPRVCTRCTAKYTPTSNRQQYCVPCQKEVSKLGCKSYYKRTYKPKGYTQELSNNNNWKGGVAAYRHLLPNLICAECGSTKKIHTHHKDGKRANNRRSNLVNLCVKCHRNLHIALLGRDADGRFTSHLKKV